MTKRVHCAHCYDVGYNAAIRQTKQRIIEKGYGSEIPAYVIPPERPVHDEALKTTKTTTEKKPHSGEGE